MFYLTALTHFIYDYMAFFWLFYLMAHLFLLKVTLHVLFNVALNTQYWAMTHTLLIVWICMELKLKHTAVIDTHR